MTLDKEQAKKRIEDKVAAFTELVNSGRDKTLNEQDTKDAFIRPLFSALGWNTDDLKEVRAEHKVSKGRVDYAFSIDGITKFYIEAKKPSEDVFDVKHALQAVNYGWLTNVTWVILTNFKDLLIMNCEWKPNKQGVFGNMLRSFNFKQYVDRFDDLSLLSKESQKQNELDKKADSEGKRPRRRSVTETLLDDFTAWRTMLVKDIQKNNLSKGYEDYMLDEIAQRILDRFIFIKTCEDKGLENPSLEPALKVWEEKERGKLVKKVREIFTYYRQTYNSGLFGKSDEDIHECDQVEISDSKLSELIERLYHPGDESLYYDFSAINADVLGNIYEQYLGHILRKTAERVKVEEKHAHRKEQGIYYTPTYIVEYIVKHTVGELLNDKNLDPEKIRILDPACGSGSFLIKAYDYMHEYYQNKEKQVTLDEEGDFDRKVKILKNNIHGVDLDEKAVEIAQLNLLLKTTQKKHRLPTLQENIKCGNSLIDDSAIAGSKAFKWEEKFKEIMSNGGFDVVIGNPPWSSKIASDTNRILAKKWDISEKNVNICALFILESLKKVKPNGFFGFLLPKVVIKNEAYYPIRKEILDNYHLKEIVDFGQFPGVASDAVALIIQNKKEDTDTEVLFYDGSILKERNKVDQKIFQKNQGLVFSLSLTPQLQGIIDKIVNNSKQLSELFKIKRGIELGQKSLITKCSNCGCYNEAETKYYGSTDKKCKKCKTKLNISRDNCIQISSSSNDKRYDTKCVSGTQLQRYSTAGFYHILSSLKGIDYKEDAFSSQKILLKRIATKIEGTFSEDKQLAFNTVYSVYNEKFSRNQFLFTLGILNSKLIHFYYEHSYNIGMNLTTQVTIDFLSTIPIKTILEAQQKPIADSVDRILSLNKRLNELGDKMTDERKVLEDEITKTDEQIDELIYKIYGISEDEKRIIEDSLNKT